MADKKTVEQNVETSAPVEEIKAPVMYTEEQVREIFTDAQKNGYISAVKQIRADLTDYLNDLIIRIQQPNN